MSGACGDDWVVGIRRLGDGCQGGVVGVRRLGTGQGIMWRLVSGGSRYEGWWCQGVWYVSGD